MSVTKQPSPRRHQVGRTRWARVAAAVAGLLIGALSVLFGPASPASAHAALVRTTPGQGSVVPLPPSSIVLTFSESVRLVPGKTQVIEPDGKRLSIGDPTVAGAVLTIPVQGSNPPRGTYLVSYRVISADSHPVGGGFTFSIGAPSDNAPKASGEQVNRVVATAVPVGKYLGYAGLVLLVGPVLVLAVLWPRRLSRTGPIRLVWIGLGLVAASTLAGLYLQAPWSTGSSLFNVSWSDLRDVVGSQFGTVLAVRLGALVAIGILLRPVVHGQGSRVDHGLLAVLGVAGLATWPLSGHPSASPVPAVSAFADTAHLASMAVWLGGLVMLVGFLLRRASVTELGAILPVWSRWAAVAVCWLVLGGVVQALIEIGSVRALFDTGYGQLVLVKVGLLAGVLGVAGYSRLLVRRRSAPQLPGRMRRLVFAELGVTLVVLGLSSVLVQTTPGRSAATEAAVTRQSDLAQTLNSSIYTLQFDVFPGQVGDNNTLHAYAYTPAGKPLKVVEWAVTAALPSGDVQPISTPVLPTGDNHAIGGVDFPVRGTWQLKFTLRISEIDEATVTALIPIK
jgi:copper transport protein